MRVEPRDRYGRAAAVVIAIATAAQRQQHGCEAECFNRFDHRHGETSGMPLLRRRLLPPPPPISAAAAGRCCRLCCSLVLVVAAVRVVVVSATAAAAAV